MVVLVEGGVVTERGAADGCSIMELWVEGSVQDGLEEPQEGLRTQVLT